jgi:hypothetical protein
MIGLLNHFKQAPEALPIAGGVAGAMLLLSPTIMLTRLWSNQHHDPNTRSPERRIALGRELALTREEYERSVAKHQQNR